jgi:hypothetical protein
MIQPQITPTNPPLTAPPVSNKTYLLAILVVIAITLGFWLSRFSRPASNLAGRFSDLTPIQNISQKSDIQVGKLYGNLGKTFKDKVIGVMERGSINGEGTHILNRGNTLSQRVSLTSSVVDLDFFVGRQVEITGETNASAKTGWLLDVGTVKVLE